MGGHWGGMLILKGLTHEIRPYSATNNTTLMVAQKSAKMLHCKKVLTIFPSPAGMSLIKLSLGGNIPAQGKFSQ